MSDFVTKIPVDVEGAKRLLEFGSDIIGVTFNPSESAVELRWGNQWIVTPFTFPLEFSLEDLAAGKLPQGAVRRESLKAQPQPAPKRGRRKG